MKNSFIWIAFMALSYQVSGQDAKGEKLKELAVPNSPAFILIDIAPSSFHTPNTPKEFVLGVIQSYEQSSNGFPQNYSAEFAPYWWIKPSKRDVFKTLGLAEKTRDKEGPPVYKENPFSGLRFTTVSIAFAGKDLIPDTSKQAQKVFSIGLKTTLVKIHRKGYAGEMTRLLYEWHKATQDELDNDSTIHKRLALNPGLQQTLFDSIGMTKKTKELVNAVQKAFLEKPLFNWDVAAAHAVYGIGDSAWRSGRTGIWTTLSSYIPLGKKGKKEQENFISLHAMFRYTRDNYLADKQKKTYSGNSVDAGGRFAFEFEKLSIGVEALYRFRNKKADPDNRTVGVINYRISENLFLRGAFGKNFNTNGKLIGLLGINWGIGTETIKL